MGGGFRQSAQVLYFGVRIRFNKYFPHQWSPSWILYANWIKSIHLKIETLMRCHCARWLFQYHQYQMVLFANNKDVECSTQFSFKIDSISISDANMNCTVCNVWLTTDSVSSLVCSLFFLSFSSFYLFFLFFTTCTHANVVDPANSHCCYDQNIAYWWNTE